MTIQISIINYLFY